MRLGALIDQANREAARRLASSRPAWIDVRALREVAGELNPDQRGLPGAPIASPDHRSHYDLGGASMGGVASRRTPVLVLEERAEGPRQGSVTYAVPEQELSDEVADALSRVLRAQGGLDVGALLGEALLRGDDLSARACAADAMLHVALVPWLLKRGFGVPVALALSEALRQGDGLARAVALGASRLACDGAAVDDSTLVTAMGCNGISFAVMLSGAEGRWFEAPWAAPASDAANLSLLGFGAFALPFRRDLAAEAREITVARHEGYSTLGGDGIGLPLGVDARRVVATAVTPRVTADGTPCPWACFVSAIEAFATLKGIR